MKKAIAFMLCAALFLGLMPLSLAEGATIGYAAVTATQPDYSDAQISTGLSDWEAARDTDDCVYVVVYSPDAAGTPPTLNVDIELSQTDPALILSDVIISGSAIAGRGLYILGDASVQWGNLTLTGTDASGAPPPALTDVSDAAGLLSAIEGAHVRRTYTADNSVFSMEAYDLVINAGVTVTVAAPEEGDYHHVVDVEHALTVNGTLTADDGQELLLRSGAAVSGLTLYEEDGVGGYRTFNYTGDADEAFLYNASAVFDPEGSSVTGLWVHTGGGGGSGGDSAGAFTGLDSENPGDYIVDENTTITSENSVSLSAGTVTVNSGVTLTVAPGGRLELRGMTLTNNGFVAVQSDNVGDPPEDGRLEIRDDSYHDPELGDVVRQGRFVNNGQMILGGGTEFLDGAELSNAASGTVTVDGFMRFAQGAVINNSGTITGGAQGRITLDNPSEAASPLTITGIGFYDDPAHTVPGDQNGQFLYDDTALKWVRDSSGGPGGGDDPVGDGSLHTVTVVAPVNGSVEAEGLHEGTIEILDMDDQVFTITPADGYSIVSVLVTDGLFTDDMSWNLSYNGDGSFDFLLENVGADLTLEVRFEEESLEALFNQNYTVLLEQTDTAEEIKPVLVNQFAYLGTVVGAGEIEILGIDTDDLAENGYGSFTFRVTLGAETSETKTGYVVQSASDVIFKLNDGSGLEIIRIAHEEDTVHGEFGVPAMDSGTMEIFGYGNILAMPHSTELADTIVDGKVPLPFYRAQFHIASFSTGLNLYGFYVIQDDALCVQVAARSGESEQKTMQWDLNRYADLTEGNYTSDVFFGNDEFILSLPVSGIGGVDSLSLETGNFTGYTVEDNEDGTYSVHFLSDYYDFVTINLTVNNTTQRQLHIHRTGVHIEAYEWEEGPPSFNVFHGTQYGTLIDFSGNNPYQVYATYYIPDGGTNAPYGLYAVYTWANGSKTTAIITDPCNNPPPTVSDFSDGVFHYGIHSSDCCDYLLYAGQGGEHAPVKINVTVLKADPTAAGTFGGVFFGSGAGVTWMREQ